MNKNVALQNRESMFLFSHHISPVTASLVMPYPFISVSWFSGFYSHSHGLASVVNLNAWSYCSLPCVCMSVRLLPLDLRLQGHAIFLKYQQKAAAENARKYKPIVLELFRCKDITVSSQKTCCFGGALSRSSQSHFINY